VHPNQLDKAINYLKDALDFSRRYFEPNLNDKVECLIDLGRSYVLRSYICINSSSIFNQRDDKIDAQKYLKLAHRFNEQIQINCIQRSNKANILSELGMINPNLAEGIEQNVIALRFSDSLSNIDEANIKRNLASLYEHKKDYNNALKFGKLAVGLFDREKGSTADSMDQQLLNISYSEKLHQTSHSLKLSYEFKGIPN
jgi:tetratricopeptide (TPR) repeat protein